MNFDPSKLEILLGQQISALESLKDDVAEIKAGLAQFQSRCDTSMKEVYDRLRETEGWQRECNGARAGRAGVQYIAYVYATIISAAAALLAWWKA